MTSAKGKPGVRRPLDVTDEHCRVFQPAVEFLGRRWVAAVLLAGARGARRFAEYRALVPGISDRLLSQRLKVLEGRGLLVREVRPTTPVLITYEPSEKGIDLLRALQPLVTWSTEHGEAWLPADEITVTAPASTNQ